MNITLRSAGRAFLVLLFSFAIVSESHATETAATIAQKLQESLLSGAGVSMKFTLAGQGKISINTDLKQHRVRMESPSMLIISDGKTIWNYKKTSRQLTIDNVSSKGSAFQDPGSLFKFSSNYSARLASHTGSTYVVEFTPNSQLQSLLKNSADIQRLSLTVNVAQGHIKIKKAVAAGSKGNSQASTLSITTLRTVKGSDFVMATNSQMKIIDLRE
jgi:outer membrane lipoprotein-sorting protein